eukprot:2132606-Prymnesium_polylepis.1
MNAEPRSKPQPRTHASLTRVFTRPNSTSAAASHQHASLESSAVPRAMHMCSSRTRVDATKHAIMQ